MSLDKLGLIAGSGRFPLLFAKAAKERGVLLIAVGVRGQTDRKLKYLSDKLFWLNPGQLKGMIATFKSEGIRKIAMAGQINPRFLFKRNFSLDEEFRKIMTEIKDKKADTIFGAIAKRLEEEQLELVDSTIFLQDLLASSGVLTQRQPQPREWEDVHFGFKLAKSIASLDIGQTVVVKDKAILAVEALEGTDYAIRRAGKISAGNLVVVKVSKPQQDMRFDIPVIGPRTINSLIKVRAVCLCVEAGKTLLIDKERCIYLADKNGISLLAL